MQLKQKWNEEWQFQKEKGRPFETVTLPHTPQLEPPENAAPFQGVSLYKKTFHCSEEWLEQRVAFLFEAVMQKCTVFINDQKVMRHFGGYLPFTVEASAFLHVGENTITVEADCRDDKSIPPGKPTKGLDFVYYGGIYRNVYLLVTPRVFLSDPVSCEEVNGGGLLIQTKSLAKDSADVFVKATFTNVTGKSQGFTVILRISNGDSVVAEKEQIITLPKGNTAASHLFSLESPTLWELNQPHLYTLECIWRWNDREYIVQESFGIRTAEVNEEGFILNGKAIYLYGVNRHQQYPYIGLAASDNAQRREARLLKEMGINTVRLAHYPQSPAFLDECDRVGLLLIEPVPGWQFCTTGKFRKRMIENVRHMVRRDRNHPSVVVFEVSPNETPRYLPGASDRFFLKLKKAAVEELPGCLTSGDTAGRRNPEKIDYDIPHTGEGKNVAPNGKRTLTREYGDWAFGGNHSSSRVNRGDGERAQQIQAWNFQWDHNNNRLTKHLLGDLVWEGIDHVRGYFPKEPVSTSGILDIFRLPKFSFHFYQSQQDEKIMLFPAIYSLKDKKKIPVYSNCDTVEAWQGGKLLATQACDNGPTVPFDENKYKKTNDNYWMTDEDQVTASKDVSDLGRHTMRCLYDGGNCEAIKHPPFTFDHLDLKEEESLTFVGEKGGVEVIRYTFREPCAPVKLKIWVIDFDLPLCRADHDFVFVYVKVLDAHGTQVYAATNEIRLQVEGGAVIGPANRASEAGIAPFLVTAKDAEQLTITAVSDGLTKDITVLNCQ